MFPQSSYQPYGQPVHQGGPTAPQTSLPPLHIQQHNNLQQQYYAAPPPASPARSTMIPPPSPSISTESPEDEDRIRKDTRGPNPVTHRWDGKIWALKVAQEPLKARMCGFGDKDRRPVSSPPVVRLIVVDEQTSQEIDYQDCKLELSHLVCTVDIFDRWGRAERNVVKHSQSSPCISAATSGPFPVTPLDRAPSQTHQPLERTDPRYAAIYGQQSATSPYQNGPPTPYANGSYNNNTPYTPNGNYAQYAPPFSRSTSYGGSTSFPTPGVSPYDSRNLPPMNTNLTALQQEQGQQNQWTRNLIGSLCTSAALLHDEEKRWGIFFIFQDLSVRTEDWFRLKFNFFNVGKSMNEIVRMHQANNASNGGSQHYHIRPNDIADQAPALASVFSAPFKVYSAKKFPGVADSTPLSKCFAQQGIKISIRKDPTGKRDRDEAGLDGDNDDDDDGEN